MSKPREPKFQKVTNHQADNGSGPEVFYAHVAQENKYHKYLYTWDIRIKPPVYSLTHGWWLQRYL